MLVLSQNEFEIFESIFKNMSLFIEKLQNVIFDPSVSIFTCRLGVFLDKPFLISVIYSSMKFKMDYYYSWRILFNYCEVSVSTWVTSCLWSTFSISTPIWGSVYCAAFPSASRCNSTNSFEDLCDLGVGFCRSLSSRNDHQLHICFPVLRTRTRVRPWPIIVNGNFDNLLNEAGLPL